MEDRLSQRTDSDLVKSWKADPGSSGAHQAAAELLGRYQCRIYRWCYGYVRDHDRALDLAQDVLMTALQKIDTLKTDARFATWMFVMTRNCCLSEIRKQKVRSNEAMDVDELPSGMSTPEAEFMQQMTENQLMTAMKLTLDKTEQEALYLQYFEGLPVDEITRILSLDGSSGARGLLQRARRKLRVALADQGLDPGREGGLGS